MKKYATVDDFLKDCPPKQRAALQRVRRIVKREVPGVEEKMSYGVPYYRIPGKGYVTAFNHRLKQKDLSLFATPKIVKLLAKDLKGKDVSGGTVHFTPEKPLSEALIRKILRTRLKQMAAKKDGHY